MAQRGLGKRLQQRGTLGVGLAPLHKAGDRHARQQLQARFAEKVGRLVAAVGFQCVVRAAIELRERQRKFGQKLLVKSRH